MLSAKTIKKQLTLMKPLLESCSLSTCRRGQSLIGELMDARHRQKVIHKEHGFENFSGIWSIPRDERRQGVILYLHGGGYTCGDINYAKGFSTTLAVESGTKVFAAAYRLAPEHRFPAALEDSLVAYKYLLDKGYSPEHITLCGESAGGGLCYALCLKLKMSGYQLPCGIIAISPWTDMTASGKSYIDNKDADPSMSQKMLDFFAESYTSDREDPLVSPVFGDLSDLPPSLIFVGADEIMLDDAVAVHQKLLDSGCRSRLIVAPERWHAYVLYNLRENREDYVQINRFLNRVMAVEKKLRWMRLDNAAKIYPAARHRNWSNVFRVSATLKEKIDREAMQGALDVTARRFPSIAARLRKGMFWYYLEQLSETPKIKEEHSYPLVRMSNKETGQCALRVIVFENRVAIECFHSLTDGNGALVFLKTLIAEYIQQKYGEYVPAEQGVLGRLDEPSEEEMEDSFLKYSGNVSAGRRERTAWRLRGTPLNSEFLNMTCLKMSADEILEYAHRYKVSATAFLCGVMMKALLNIQSRKVPSVKRRKPIKVLIPVNLRKIFPSKSLRNFVLYTTPQIDPRLGEYSVEEIAKTVHHWMGLEINAKQMSTKIATNVNDEKSLFVKIMPLFIKNAVMKLVFNIFGERKSCLTLSNLGMVKLPDIMYKYVERLDFVLGVQSSAPYNCGVISYGDTLYVSFIRNIKESELEAGFFEVLRDLGISVTAESNFGGMN